MRLVWADRVGSRASERAAQDLFDLGSVKELFAIKCQDSFVAFECGEITEAEHFATYFTDRRPVDGSRVTQQTPLKVRKEFAEEEVSFKCEVNADITIGTGDEQRKFTCVNPDLVLDVNSERQWKQIGNDPTQLRLQVSDGGATGRPFPLADADLHFRRLRAYGVNIIRLLVLWEGLEPRSAQLAP